MKEQTRAAGRQPAMAEGERRNLILDAAERVFSEQGYGAATMEEIAKACGMAKKTLYKLFPDKLSVFGALIESHDHPHFSWAERTDEVPELATILTELARFILSPRQIRLTRLVIAEARMTPELAQRFYDECLVRNRAIVVEHFSRSGIPRPAGLDVEAIVDSFVGSALSIVQLKALMLDLDPDAVERELQARVAATLAVFGAASGR